MEPKQNDAVLRPMRATLIVNTLSRTGADAFAQARDLIEAAGVNLVAAHGLDDPGALTTKIADAIAAKTELLILGGGDGTISSGVDQLVGTDIVFGLLPLGTANSFARSLGIPLDLAGAVDVIAHGRVARVDLGMIDDDYFANCAAIGLAPLIAETIPHGLKRWLGRVGYLGWAAVSLARFRPFTLTVDGERIRALEVRIANGTFQGGTELVESADVMSGEIVVQAVLGRTRARLLWSWFASIFKLPGRHLTTRDFKGRSIRVETVPRLPISIDGEIAARTPVTAHVAPAALRMMLPR
jgi:YegS/Rv2252/BmrU family lipid kinase